MSRIKPWHIVVAGWVVFAIYAYPGLMTRDTYDQLIEARNGVFSDAHPPMMQAIWNVLEQFITGTFSMLALQTATFIAGVYLLLRRAISPHRAAITASALLWFPPIGAVMSVVWKDCLMAGLLALGIALLFSARRGVRIVALVLLCVATAVRYNAFAATLVPIVLLFTWSDAILGVRRYALALAVWLTITFAAFGLNSALTSKPTHYWHASLALHDIVGTLYYVEHDIEDRKLRRAFTGTPLVLQANIHQHIRAHYKPDEHVWTVTGPHRMWNMSLVETAPKDQRVAIEQAWKTIVKGRPIAYLRHRVQVLAAVLGLAGDSWDRPIIVTHDYQNANELRELGIPVGYSRFQDGVGSGYSAFTETFLFRPYFYLALALVVLVLGRRQRDVLALLGSGLLVESSLFLIGPSADYRYSHWLVVTTCISLVLVVVRRYQAGTRAIGG